MGKEYYYYRWKKNFCLSRDSSSEIDGNDKLYQRLTRQKIILTATFITIIRFPIASPVVLSIPSGVDGAAAAAVQVVPNERQRSACLWRPWSKDIRYEIHLERTIMPPNVVLILLRGRLIDFHSSEAHSKLISPQHKILRPRELPYTSSP